MENIVVFTARNAFTFCFLSGIKDFGNAICSGSSILHDAFFILVSFFI